MCLLKPEPEPCQSHRRRKNPMRSGKFSLPPTSFLFLLKVGEGAAGNNICLYVFCLSTASENTQAAEGLPPTLDVVQTAAGGVSLSQFGP